MQKKMRNHSVTNTDSVPTAKSSHILVEILKVDFALSRYMPYYSPVIRDGKPVVPYDD